VFDALQCKVAACKPIDRQCVLVFDEITIKTQLLHNSQGECIEGFENLGSLGRTLFVANHALAFIFRGLASKWKQCIGYSLTCGPIAGKKIQYHLSMRQLANLL